MALKAGKAQVVCAGYPHLPQNAPTQPPTKNKSIFGGGGMFPKKRSNPKTMHQAGELRKEPTPAERKLWAYIRNAQLNGVKFRRQHAIGSYIVDFCSLKHKLIIELDGSPHLEQEEYDQERTRSLKEQGYRVVRFWNEQVMNDLDGVIRAIAFMIRE
jgi:very-short-patch-repair endonuclease